MATSGELADTLSKSLGFALGTVNFYGQHLRDAKLLSTGGRGTSAASMNAADAINWLVAMCSAETAKSAPGVVDVTISTPLYEQRWIKGGAGDTSNPHGELSFLHAENVRTLMLNLLEDERAGKLGPVLITLDFYGGGGHVVLNAAGVDGAQGGILWAVEMEFIHTFGSRPAIRHRDPEETPITAKRATINRVSRGVFEDINKVLAA